MTADNLLVPVEDSATAAIEVETGDVSDFTSFVTTAEVRIAELTATTPGNSFTSTPKRFRARRRPTEIIFLKH